MVTALEITSKSNPFLMKVASLQEKKYREKHRLFFVEGIKLVREAWDNGLPLVALLFEESREAAIAPFLTALARDEGKPLPPVYRLSAPCFGKISTEKAPQGVIAVIKYLDNFQTCIKIEEGALQSMGQTLCLCGVRDPSNLGAIIRSAAAFGTETLLLSADCADLYHPKTLRAAMGNLFKLSAFTVSDLPGTLHELQRTGRRIYAAELRTGAVSLTSVSVRKKDIFLIGNEGHGIPNEISACADGSVYIPMEEGVESLNASVAASVLLWEQAKAKE